MLAFVGFACVWGGWANTPFLPHLNLLVNIYFASIYYRNHKRWCCNCALSSPKNFTEIQRKKCELLFFNTRVPPSVVFLIWRMDFSASLISPQPRSFLPQFFFFMFACNWLSLHLSPKIVVSLMVGYKRHSWHVFCWICFLLTPSWYLTSMSMISNNNTFIISKHCWNGVSGHFQRDPFPLLLCSSFCYAYILVSSLLFVAFRGLHKFNFVSFTHFENFVSMSLKSVLFIPLCFLWGFS